MVMRAIYSFLLCLYPTAHRKEFGDEMTSVFREAQRALAPSLAAKLSFYQREYFGLLSGAVFAHANRLFGSGIPFRRFDMRPQFRFPRATVVLLLVNFVGAVFVIAKGKAMSRVVGTWPAFGSVALHLLVFALLAVSAAAIFSAVLHNLRCSGVHRFENVPTATNSGGSRGDR